MSLEECYQLLGGDYADVCRRLPSKKLVEKFIGKFLEDKSFEALCLNFREGNRKEAFLAAHTLKGICANLGFRSLLNSSSQLTELLRSETDTIPETAQPWMEQVKTDYEKTADTIQLYFSGGGAVKAAPSEENDKEDLV